MRPRFRLEVNGSDITKQIADRVLSIKITDESGQKSDTVDVTLDDRDGGVDLPETAAKLKISLGYEETQLVDLGEYTIDEISISMNPQTVKIRAKASDGGPDFKATKSRSWHGQTIGEIISTIAGEHQLIPSVHERYAERTITHIDQENESDAHFLTRLAGLYGAVAKPASGRLVFLPEGEGLSATGNELTAAMVELEDLISLKGTVKERGIYSSVVTKYRDKETNREVEVEVEAPSTSKGFLSYGASLKDKKLYTSEDMAREAGQSKMRQLKGGNVTVDFTIAGRPDIFAERPVTLSGVRSPLAGTWIIKTVSHDFGPGGFTTKISAGSKPV